MERNLVELQRISISFGVFSVYSKSFTENKHHFIVREMKSVCYLKKLESPCTSNLILPFINTEFGSKAALDLCSRFQWFGVLVSSFKRFCFFRPYVLWVLRSFVSIGWPWNGSNLSALLLCCGSPGGVCTLVPGNGQWSQIFLDLILSSAQDSSTVSLLSFGGQKHPLPNILMAYPGPLKLLVKFSVCFIWMPFFGLEVRWFGPGSLLQLFLLPSPTCTYTVLWGSLKTYLHTVAQLVPSIWNALSALTDRCFPPHALRARLTLPLVWTRSTILFLVTLLFSAIQ